MTLLDPLDIPLTNQDFRAWMIASGEELNRLDHKWYDIQTNYFVRGNDKEAYRLFGLETVDLMCDLLGLKYAIAAVYALWNQVKDECLC